MTYSIEQLIASNKANVQSLEDMTTQAFAGFEKLVELNLATSKTALSESFSHSQAVLNAKDPQSFMALQTGLFQQLTEKSVAYGQGVYTLANGTGAELTKVLESKMAEAQSVFADLVENLVKNAPAGAETAVAAFKSAVNASQNVIESAQNSAKKAAEAAESSFAAVTNQAVNAATSASKKR